MSRSNPARFVLSVAAEVAAVVFIVSVLPRVDLRTSAGAAPALYHGSGATNEAPSLLPRITSWPEVGQSPALSHSNGPAVVERPSNAQTYETSHYQRRSPQQTASSHATREPTPLIAVDPRKADYVEQRLDRASQDLVNTVGSYVSQAATDVLQVQPPPVPSQRTSPPALAPSFPRLPATVTPPASSFYTVQPAPGSFPTQPQSTSQAPPRPWARY